MRFREFRTPLFEFLDTNAQAALKSLDRLEDTVEANPEAVQKASAEISKLIAQVKQSQVDTRHPVVQPVQKPVVKQQPQPTPPQQNVPPNTIGAEPPEQQVSEVMTATMSSPNIDVNSMMTALHDQIQLLKSMIQGGKTPTKVAKQVEQQCNLITSQIASLSTASREQGKQEGGQEIIDMLASFKEQELPELSKSLTEKVLGVLNTLKEVNDAQIEKGSVSPRERKTVPDKNSIYRQIHDPLEALFAKLADPSMGSTAVDFKNKIDKVKDFMIRCQEGIFDVDEMLSRRQGNVRDLIPENDKGIYETIFKKILSITVSGGGSWGPGEVGLAVLGRPIEKEKGKGDLIVGQSRIPIELKSGQDATAGARIGGDGVVQARAALGNFVSYFKTFVEGLKLPALPTVKNRPIFTYQVEETKSVTKNKVTTRVGTGTFKTKKLFATNMSSPNWFNQFNQQILAKVNDKKRPVVAKTFLNNVMKMSVSSVGMQAYETALQKFNTLENMLDTEGYIEYRKFLKELTKVWYFIYSKTDDVKFILVLNQSNGSFKLARNVTELVGNIDKARDKQNPKGIEITGGLDFGAGQIQLSPQVGVW
jgi:hypothetical protein